MRGIPGSGKSTLVSQIILQYPESVVCSADKFHMRDGEYKFDKSNLKAAHEFSQSDADDACKRGRNVVIIDNTNIRAWEYRPYVKLATKYGYTYIIVVPRTNWKDNAEELARRNIHGVDLESVQRKINQFEEFIPLYYGWFLNPVDSKRMVDLSKSCLLECVRKCTQLLLNMFGDTNGRYLLIIVSLHSILIFISLHVQ